MSTKFPGLAFAILVAALAALASFQFGFPIILAGLLLGLALSVFGQGEMFRPGLEFAGRYPLQVGIVLLGVQVTFAQVASLGWFAFAGLLAVMVAAMAAALLTSRAVGERWEAGLLAGGATAICGASAALALYGVIGKERVDQTRFAVTLVGVMICSAIAMAIYPALAHWAGLSDTQAGFLIGASVHDAGQAIGGGFAYSDAAGTQATVIKLSRVAMLAPMVALTAWIIGRSAKGAASGKRASVPWFVVAFFVVLAINSFVPIPADYAGTALDISKALLLLAVTATGLRSRLGLLWEAGWRTLAPVLAASLTAFAVAWAVMLGLA
ncbi:YeiH family protein [Pseudoblastomonas halimionae]|uniref:Putative sulfate exporter family transporter n=1 Tax=Alteriqipengyuania halimionae TaxID=1926630 RepID=A0A6I4U744_9SPHN|nr:putative sulfate exporter family transporter [Alteriqipengyuania halimionae]MXP10272.1 putative sulfate exporter family transporter [Alteriqipengyuania halimionae]